MDIMVGVVLTFPGLLDDLSRLTLSLQERLDALGLLGCLF
jgi:hypothetical protein